MRYLMIFVSLLLLSGTAIAEDLMSESAMRQCAQRSETLMEKEKDIENMADRRDAIESDINSIQNQYGWLKAEINIKRVTLETACGAYGDQYSCNNASYNYDQAANRWNNLVERENRLIDEYNRLNNRVNSRIDDYERLGRKYDAMCTNTRANTETLNKVCKNTEYSYTDFCKGWE